MPRNTYTATVSNLSMMAESGLKLPSGLLEALRTGQSDGRPDSSPVALLRFLLESTHGGDAEQDPMSSELRSMAAQVTPSQVWDLMRTMYAETSHAPSVKMWVCMRDGLLPHDKSLVGLFAPTDPDDLRLDALSWAMAWAEQSKCNQVNSETGASTGAHFACTPLDRVSVFNQVKDLVGVACEDKLKWLFPHTMWSGASHPGPGATGPLESSLLEDIWQMLERDLADSTTWSAEWKSTIKWFADKVSREVITAEQVEWLRKLHPGLTSDLLAKWLGPHGPNYLPLVVNNQLGFLHKPLEFSYDEWCNWLAALIEKGHPSVALMDEDVVAKRVLGHLNELPWEVRKALLLRRYDWTAQWLGGRYGQADPLEVRELIACGHIHANQAFYRYPMAPEAVQRELLETPGFAATLAGKVGDHVISASDRWTLQVVLEGVMATLPKRETRRVELMTRILAATETGNGPLDGKARLSEGVAALSERWDARLRRLGSSRS